MSEEGSGPPGAEITRAIGKEMRRTRTEIGWSRAQLVSRLGYDLHQQTLGLYESGARQCTVTRFVEVCRAMGVAAPEVLAMALQRATIDIEVLDLRVDLGAVLTDKRAAIWPLREWARNRLDGGEQVVRLEPAALREVAAFCGRTPEAMFRLLAEFSPEINRTKS